MTGTKEYIAALETESERTKQQLLNIYNHTAMPECVLLDERSKRRGRGVGGSGTKTCKNVTESNRKRWRQGETERVG